MSQAESTYYLTAQRSCPVSQSRSLNSCNLDEYNRRKLLAWKVSKNKLTPSNLGEDFLAWLNCGNIVGEVRLITRIE